MSHQTTCTKCGKNTDGLMTCYKGFRPVEHLCPDCMEKSKYCLGCGYMEDLADGYCDGCWEDIETLFDQDPF